MYRIEKGGGERKRKKGGMRKGREKGDKGGKGKGSDKGGKGKIPSKYSSRSRRTLAEVCPFRS